MRIAPNATGGIIAAMYEALDEFLNYDTWTSGHWEDDARFLRALDGIVRRRDFSSQRLGLYIERKYSEQFGTTNEQSDAIKARYTEMASTVRRFLEATGQIAT